MAATAVMETVGERASAILDWLQGLLQSASSEQQFGALEALAVAALTLAGSMLVAAYQLCRARREHQDRAALEALAHVRTPELVQALRRLWLRNGRDLRRPTDADLRRAFADRGRHSGAASGSAAEQMRDDIDAVAPSMEVLGVLVFEGVISISHVDHVLGALVTGSWRNIRSFVIKRRTKENVGDHYLEWYQWLAEQLEKRDAVARRQTFHTGVSAGAYKQYEDWVSPHHWRWREARSRWCCRLRTRQCSGVPRWVALGGKGVTAAALVGVAVFDTTALAILLGALLLLLVLAQLVRGLPAPAAG